MTSVGREKLGNAVSLTIAKTAEKYHLTRAEVVGVLMMCLLAHSGFDYDDEEDLNEEENE